MTIAAYQKEFDELLSLYRINIPATDEHLIYFPTLKKGELISQNPEVPQNSTEAFELLKNYYAALQCVICKMLFIEIYYTWNEPAIRAEIQLIEDFINAANQLSYTKACTAVKKSVPDPDEDKLEYLRLKNGFYEGYQMTWYDHNLNSRAASVYGKYFLFYDFLKARLRSLTKQRNPMEYFNKFINEIQSLDIRIREHYLENGEVVPLDHFNPDEHPGLPLQKRKFWDLSHYDQDKSNYEAEITRLQQLAINDILLLTPEQIRMQLNRVELIKTRFNKFWEVFSEKEKLLQRTDYRIVDLQIKILPYFIVDKIEEHPCAPKFVHDLYDAFMFKESCLLGFESQVKEALGEHRQKTKDSTTIFNSFNELFEYAIQFELIKYSSNFDKALELSSHDYQYSNWLRGKYDIDVNNGVLYRTFLKIELFADYLREKKNGEDKYKKDHELIKNHLQEKAGLTENKEKAEPVSKSEFSLRQIALMLYYKGESITRGNCDNVVKQYGYTSGEKLFQLFTLYSSRANRIGKETTRKKNQNKLELFEKVISKLPLQIKQRAIDEMNTFKAAFESDYQ